MKKLGGEAMKFQSKSLIGSHYMQLRVHRSKVSTRTREETIAKYYIKKASPWVDGKTIFTQTAQHHLRLAVCQTG